MARKIEYWHNVILDSILGTPELSDLHSNTSKVSIFRLFAYCVAYTAWVLDNIFDLHKTEVDEALLKQKPHKLSWYREKALMFQYGYSLVPESDVYDNTGVSEDDIDTSKVVKYCAVNQADNESRLVMKIAGETSGELNPLTTGQFNAFKEYVARYKDAGVFITFINYLPDKLFLNMRIFYDPLILDNEGNNILTGGKPVEEALTEFMKELPFNGELALFALVDKLQSVSGVIIPHLDAASASSIDPEVEDYGVPIFIDVKKKPDAGYFKIENFDNISYVPYYV